MKRIYCIKCEKYKRFESLIFHPFKMEVLSTFSPNVAVIMIKRFKKNNPSKY